MDKTRKAYAPVAVNIAFTAATLLVSALLIVRCAAIYLAGTSASNMTGPGVYINPVYSPEIVANNFAGLLWAVVLWLALFAAAVIVRAASGDKAVEKLVISSETRLKLMVSRVTPTPKMLAERRWRKAADIICAVVFAVCVGCMAPYMLRSDNFASRDLEAVMGKMLRYYWPWLTTAMLAILLIEVINEKSFQREIKAAKDAPKREPEPPKAQKRSFVTAWRIALIALAAAFIIAGIANGGMYDVLVKAVNICTECIGLG